MKYDNYTEAVFLSRPNRFIADVLLNGEKETVHVKNTGRCKELLTENANVYLTRSSNPTRKTKYDLIAVEKHTDSGVVLINMDSQIPNAVAYEWLPLSGLFSEKAIVRREVTYGKSRFDLYVEDSNRRAFIEVKGVTLENNGVASFPDAPTERGVKHINELVRCVDDGFEAYILFVIQMKGVSLFKPNDDTHRAFGDALRNASEKGVKILAYDCCVTPSTITINNSVNIEL